MILTIVGDSMAPGQEISATWLARRRALAGRNVLLLKQNCAKKHANQYTRERDHADWLRTEMKAGASSSELASDLVEQELASENNAFHDIIIDIPKPFYVDAKTVLANSGLLIFHMELNLWNKERQANLLKCIRHARRSNAELPVLIIVDNITCMQSQSFVSKIAHSLANIRFIYLDVAGDLALVNLYRAVYLS